MKALSPYSLAHQLSDKGRYETFKAQHEERGFDDTELWNLDVSIAKFIFPRLKAFSKSGCRPGHLEEEEWLEILNKMIRSFELMSDDVDAFSYDAKINMEIEEGLELFHQYYRNLWN